MFKYLSAYFYKPTERDETETEIYFTPEISQQVYHIFGCLILDFKFLINTRVNRQFD